MEWGGARFGRVAGEWVRFAVTGCGAVLLVYLMNALNDVLGRVVLDWWMDGGGLLPISESKLPTSLD